MAQTGSGWKGGDESELGPWKGGTVVRGSAKRRCVVLLRRDQPMPEELLKGLERRKIRVRLVENRPEVIAELALGDVGAVILVEPEAVRGAEELREVIRGWYPEVGVWVYRAGKGAGGKGGRLQKIAGGEGEEAKARPGGGTNGRREGNSVERRVAVQGGSGIGQERLTAGNLLTEAELQMLLGADEPEKLDGGPGGG